MNILFSGDFLRPFPDGTPGNQVSNVRWLADILSPCLSFACEKKIPVVMELPGCSGSDMLHGLGLPCSMDGWLAAVDMPDWTPISPQMDRLIGDCMLVLGFELPRPFKRHLDSRNIPWVDFAISPYRFGDDLFLMADSSDEAIRRRMRAGRLVSGDFAKYAGPLKARIRREIKLLAGRNPLVVFGQTEVDRSICRNGVAARWTDYACEIKSLASDADIIYFKPHPYASRAATSANIEFFSRYAPVVELNEHAYETLVREQPATFLTLSSGVTFEAPCFGKRVNHLLPLPYEIDTDSNSKSFSGFVVLGSAMLSPVFWEHVLTGKDNGPLFLAGDVPANRLRESLGVWWSFENHDRSMRLAKWASSPRFESMENNINLLNDSMDSVEEKNTTQGESINKLGELLGGVLEALTASVAKDADIRRLLDEVSVLRSQLVHAESEAVRLHTLESECGSIRRMIYGVSWYTHLYRGWKRLVGDKQYNEFSSRTLKRYTNLNVPWHTHLYRAGLGLFVKGDKPWHTHLYRSLHSWQGNRTYAPQATSLFPSGFVSSSISYEDAFAREKESAGV